MFYSTVEQQLATTADRARYQLEGYQGLSSDQTAILQEIDQYSTWLQQTEASFLIPPPEGTDVKQAQEMLQNHLVLTPSIY